MLKNLVLAILILLVASMGGLAHGVYSAAQVHKESAIEFWGERYDKTDASARVDWGFWGNLFIPSGGPLISTEFANVCPDTPLSMVPIKLDKSGRGQVLCGLADDTETVAFDVDDLENPDLRDAILRGLSGEIDSDDQPPVMKTERVK